MCVQFYSFILSYCTKLRLSTFSNKRFIIVAHVYLRVATPFTANETSWTSTWTIRRQGGWPSLERLLTARRVWWSLRTIVVVIAPTLRLEKSAALVAGLVGVSAEPLSVARLLVLPCPSRRRVELWGGRAQLGWGRRGWTRGVTLRLRTESRLQWLRASAIMFFKPCRRGSHSGCTGLFGRFSMKLTRFLLRLCLFASSNRRALTNVT